MITADDVLDPDVIDAMARLESRILANPKVTAVTGLQTLVAQAQTTPGSLKTGRTSSR